MYLLWCSTSCLPEVFELGSDNGRNRVVEKYSVRTDESVSVGEVPRSSMSALSRGLRSARLAL